MYEGDHRLKPVKVSVTTRIGHMWTMWSLGIMSPMQAFRTFFLNQDNPDEAPYTLLFPAQPDKGSKRHD